MGSKYGIDLSDRERASSVAAVSGDAIPWVEDVITGASFALLQIDRLSGLWTVRTRLCQGTTVQLHLHSGPVYAVTLSGRWGYPELNVTCGSGDFLVEHAGTAHTLTVIGDETADVIFSIVGSITYFDSDGSADRIEDWKTVLEEYLDGCNTQQREPSIIGL